MNGKRILLGGLLAGVLINVGEAILNAGILLDEYEAMMATYGLTEASWAMVGYPIGAFIFGFAVAWLYAAIRPRFGAGWMTGARAGLLLFIVGYLVPGSWFGAMGLLPSTGSLVLGVVWALAECVAAGVLAGWLYKEDEGAVPATVEHAAAPVAGAP